MTSNALVTVVIVTYKSRKTIGHTLETLQASLESGLANCVVVDNASDDGTADYVEKNFSGATLIRSPENIGFGRGCNLGFQSADTPYVMFLNPDASIEEDSLRRLIGFMDAHPSAGIAGPATYDTTAEEFQPVGMLLTPMVVLREAFRIGEPHPQRRTLKFGETPYLTNWVCGSSMLARTSMLQEIGGFDPRFFLYFEETDLCLRASRAGHQIWAVGECIAHHIGAASARESGSELTFRESGSIIEFFYPSRFYYLAKNFGTFSAVSVELIERSVDWLRWLLKKALRRRPDAKESPTGRPFLRLPRQVDQEA